MRPSRSSQSPLGRFAPLPVLALLSFVACGEADDGDPNADPSPTQPGPAVAPIGVSPSGTDAVSPGPVMPGTVTPGTVTPSPGTVTPGTVTPGTVTPGTVSPVGVEPTTPQATVAPVEPAPTELVSYAADIEPIFVRICSDCHQEGGYGGANGVEPLANHNLSMGDGYMALTTQQSQQNTDMALVGDTPEESYLWHKLNGTQNSVGGTGERMPMFGALTNDELGLVEAWIIGGAQP